MPDFGDVIGFFGGFATGLFAHWLVIIKERADRRRVFRTEVDKLLVRLEGDGIKDHELATWHQSSIESFRDKCAEITGDIAKKHREDFKLVRTQYANLSKREIENIDANQFHNLATGRPIGKVVNYDRKQIVELLEKIKNLAK